jgi:hypothetical protein
VTGFVLAVLILGAAVFTASAAGKLRGRATYRDYHAGLRATRLLPPGRPLAVTAVTLVLAEAVAAASLTLAAIWLAARLAGAFPLAGAALAVAAALSAVLAAGVAVVIRRGIQAPCRCFGGSPARPLGVVHLTRNLCLLAVLAAALIASLMAPSGRLGPAGVALAVVAGLVAGLVLIRWDDLASLFAPPPPARPLPSAKPGPAARRDRTGG